MSCLKLYRSRSGAFNSLISCQRSSKKTELWKNQRRSYCCLKANKASFLKKYETAKQAWKGELPPPDINPLGVFANNELNLADINVYGFDYDYTLAVYKESFHNRICEMACDWLVEKYEYPDEVRQLKYIPGFAIRGLHYDMQTGLLMKLDSFHRMQLDCVYRGLKPISKNEIMSIYGGSVPWLLIDGTPKVKQLNDLFSVPEVCLLSNITELFKKHGVDYHPEQLLYDIQNAVQSIHPLLHKELNEENIGRYLDKQLSMPKLLNRLKEDGKKMFLISNSPFKFVDIGMKYMIGSHWIDLFEVIVVEAKKSTFFTDRCRPFRVFDVPTKSQLLERVIKLEKGKVYIEGNLKDFQQMTGWCGSSVLYIGDQIFSDVVDLKSHHGWRTGAVIFELADEINVMSEDDFRRSVGWLHSLEHLIQEFQIYGDMDESNKGLLVELEELRLHTSLKFNKQFGSMFKTHHNPSYFSEKLFQYSDVYMSNVTNLLNYSSNHIFHPRRVLLPHESSIPHM